MCMLGTHTGEKRTLGHLELVLQMVVSCHVVARNQTLVLYKSNKCS